MNHIGVIFCAYATKDYLAQSLAPWIALRKIGPIKVSICAVNVLFKGFQGDDDGTRELLRGYLERGEIDHLVDHPDGISETEARGMALTWLVDQGCEMSWQVDSDEYYTLNEIQNILDFVEANPWTVSFKLSLKNYVFDDKTYLVEPFTPTRIHRVSGTGGYLVAGFQSDNGTFYQRPWSKETIPDLGLSQQTVPMNVAWIRHDSWPNSPRSKAKCEYQTVRWGNVCSFAWDEHKGLVFNPSLPTPKVVREA